MLFTGKKILVTGGTGFIGANLARKLLAEGAEVHFFVRHLTNTVRIATVADSVTIHQVDLNDHQTTKTALESLAPDGIFHMAAVNQSFVEHPTLEEVTRTNMLASMRFMEAASALPLDFFVNTSTFVEVGPKNAPLKESDIFEPMEFYGISRVPATLYAQALGKYYTKPFVTIRVFTPYGPWMQKGRIVYALITEALSGEPLTLTRPQVTRDFIYIDDLVELYVRAATHAIEYAGHIFNGGSGVSTTLQELSSAVLAATGSASPIVWNNQNVSYDNAHWEADLTKTAEMLDWRPHYDLKTGVENTVIWFQKNPRYWSPA